MGQGSSCTTPVFSGSLSCPHLTRPGLGHLPRGSATPASAHTILGLRPLPKLSQGFTKKSLLWV